MNHPGPRKSSSLKPTPAGATISAARQDAGFGRSLETMPGATSYLCAKPLRALAALAAVVIGLSAFDAPADDYPNRPITLIVPSPAGGGTDTQARILAPKLGELLGQP